MPFKLKHIVHGPAKVIREIARPLADSGMFGVRHDQFRVIGIPIGKDLVPVVTAAVTIAAVAIGGPALASAAAIPSTSATIAVSALTNATVAGCMGGNTTSNRCICQRT